MTGERQLDVGTLGAAVGLAGGAFYIGCVLVMVLVEKDVLVQFLNSIVHGLDLSAVLRLDLGIWDSLLGLVNTLALGWVTGVLIGFIYNYTARVRIFADDSLEG